MNAWVTAGLEMKVLEAMETLVREFAWDESDLYHLADTAIANVKEEK